MVRTGAEMGAEAATSEDRGSGVERLPVQDGVILFDRGSGLADPRTLFDEARWALAPAPRGRGSAFFVDDGEHRLVWRRFRRGGLVARLVRDRYLFLGEKHVRSFAEWRLLALLRSRSLPVPRPVAARYRRAGGFYTADLMTERLVGTRMLSELAAGELAETSWGAVGRCIRRFHAAGVWHADLNAHNVLIDGRGEVHLIDFDRGRLRSPGSWTAANLARLRRSLGKLFPGDARIDRGWAALIAAYESG